ncbi:hypothetical protein Tco_0781213 [Tanacetum coccineum]
MGCANGKLDTNHEENDSNDDNHRDNLDEMLHDVESNVDEKNIEKLYANPKDAKLLRWHAEERKNDGKMRHVAPQWKNIDRYFKKFGSEIRNILFGLCSDGINPFKSLSSRHSTWPVLLCIYNLPPWLCMKRKYIMMSLLIQGPKQPGNDIDVYLRPLIDDMIDLWETSVDIYDAHKKERFQLFAMIYCTINDFLAYGNLSGYGTKGEKACPVCEKNTHSQWLTNCRKRIYMGHRRSLDRYHPYRKKKKLFDGTIEDRSMAEPMDGYAAFSQVADLNITFGKKVKAPPKRIWKKRSIFWELKYWTHLRVRHCLDVMHIEKNVCESLLGLLLNIPGKTKDGVNARKDMVKMGIRNELAPQVTNGTKMYLPPACYTLSKAEKTSFCECLHGVKVPSGYSANIKNLVSMKDLKLLGMKSHDCHVLLTQMIPIAIRGVMPPPVRQTITKLCLFFNMIHSKVIDHEKLDELQRDIILILCQLEMYFPPSFFDVMVHLMSHIVEEIKLAGPVFLRYMYPFERYMGFLKGYVRNRYRPEGSIVQGYAAEEVVQFCTNYMDDVADIGLLQPQHQENNNRRDQRWLEAEHKRTFSQWLADKVIRMSPTNVDADVIQLGEVTLIATTTDSSRMTIAKNLYYGVVEDIWELDYTSFVIPLLKCKWVNNTRGVKVDSDSFTCVNLSTNGYLSDPFILAKQATRDPPEPRTRRGINRIQDLPVGESVEFNQFGQAVGKWQYLYGKYIGTRTRRLISILKKNWKQVTKEEKNFLWSDIKAHFRLENDDVKKCTLTKWKAFKIKLRVKFMLKKPRLGPKGYQGFEQQWQEERNNPGKATELHLIPDICGSNYYLARAPRDKNRIKTLPPELIDVLKNLVQATKELAQGSNESKVGVDPFILVLGPEHGGRTRGVGCDIGYKKEIEGYVRKKRAYEQQKDIEEIRNEVRQQMKEELKSSDFWEEIRAELKA